MKRTQRVETVAQKKNDQLQSIGQPINFHKTPRQKWGILEN